MPISLLRLYLAFACLSLLVGPALAQPREDEEKQAILLALMFDNGVVWPFAEYSSDVWRVHPNPNKVEKTEKAAVWTASFPSTAEWTTFSRDHFVFRTAPKAIEIPCYGDMSIGLLIDNRNAPDAEARGNCGAIVDLAYTSVPLNGYKFKASRPAADTSELQVKILAKYSATFAKEARRFQSRSEGKRLKDVAKYKKGPLHMEGLYDFGELQYFIIVEIYSPPEKTLSDTFAYYEGWISNGKLIQSQFSFDDGSGNRIPGTIPLGLITIEDTTFVIVKEHGYESQSLSILKVGKEKMEEISGFEMGGS